MPGRHPVHILVTEERSLPRWLEAVGGPGCLLGLLSYAAYLRFYQLLKAVKPRGVRINVEGKRRGWTWTHRPLPLTKAVVGSVLLDLRWDTWRCAPGTRAQPDSSKVHPFHGLSMGFTTKHKIFNNDVSDKAWLAQDGVILFGLFQFFEFSNYVPAWQIWSPNTFHLLIVPVKSRNNTEILIQSITVNISQDPNVYRELSKQLVGKE